MKSELRRHIVGILLFKLLMLTFLGYMFYGVIGKRKYTPDAVANTLLSPSAPESPHGSH